MVMDFHQKSSILNLLKVKYDGEISIDIEIYSPSSSSKYISLQSDIIQMLSDLNVEYICYEIFDSQILEN